MKKILFLHSSSELYGSDRSLLNLIKNLDKKIFNITVVLPEEGPLVEELRKVEGVTIYIYEVAVLRRKNLSILGMFKYCVDFTKSTSYLKKLIKKDKIDIIYTNTSVVFPGGIVAKILKKKSIWHIREIIKNTFERKVISFIVNSFSDMIITNSKATADAIGVKEEKLEVIYNAIEDSKIQSNREQSQEDYVVVGMAGRINRWKGQKLFVDMANQVLKKHNNVKFLIAGDVYKGEEALLEDLKSYIHEKGVEEKITLLGQVNDMDSFYKQLDIFILPSVQPEPFGLVVIEAMDREIPVVATRHGGPVEIIDDGENGFLVDFNSSEEMSKCVNRLIEDKKLRIDIGKKGKIKRKQIFSIDNYVTNISRVLNNI